MKIKQVLTGVLSIGVAVTLAACSGETEDQEEIMENPPETETTPDTGETDPGMDSEMEEDEPASGSEPGSIPGDAEDPNTETDEDTGIEDPAADTEEDTGFEDPAADTEEQSDTEEQ
ncbi:hypothetical protein [Oceanobacillus alkalisoli]|uniref:hypothetical protein n=1 Tax=Oceanobacillus alkalisoli TaxID=2925113 RepID=UPI001EF02D13|nr:hypothetical protein [Oceanobacillus alkalisoli]MCF3944662.1 hypothetical protein [Oceanobacillus alkalisoli]MCG5105229.1 hypothetical protein [Oceanobacillus alkalisoli]